MKLRALVSRLLYPSDGTEGAALRWAERYYHVDQRVIARAVAFSIAETLCVPVSQFTPDTDLVSELGADEAWEWKTMELCLGERLSAEIIIDPDVVGRRPKEIVAHLIANPPRPKVLRQRWWKRIGRRKTA